MGPLHTLQYAEIRDGAASRGPVRLQSLAQTSSVTGMLSQLEWVPLATRRANTRLCMMYRVAYTPVGDPWTPWLTFAQRTTRGSHAWKYIPISTSHDAYKFSFLPRTIIAWNQLPSIIIDAPSIDAFRSRLITSQP